jgi:hypothetical protein
MTGRLFLVIGLGILLSLSVGMNTLAVMPSEATTSSASNPVTVVGSDTVTPGSFGSERVLCPAGTVAVGGGIDLGNVLTMKVTSSAPTFAQNNSRLIFQPNGTNPAPIGWQASARNDDAVAKSFKVAVICAPLSGLSTVVGSDTVAPGSFGSERVLCPAGRVAVGGGIDLGNVLTMKVTSSAPTFAQNNSRLIFQPSGTNPAPIGWQATARNDGTTTKSFKVAVICAPLRGISTVVDRDGATPGSFGSERVLCPAGMIAMGGGIDLDNVLTMKVTSSGPTFAQNNSRLIFQPNGTNPAPIGWQGSARNDDATTKSLKVAVICRQAVHRVFLPIVVR